MPIKLQGIIVSDRSVQSFYSHDTQGIRAEPDDDHISGFDSERNMAILHYAEVELKVPTTMQDNSTKPLVETNLIVRSVLTK